MREISLDEIISKYETYVNISQPYNITPIFLKESVKDIMLEFGEKLLELAAENAEIDEFPPVNEDGMVYRHEISVFKPSITDTIKQIE